MICKLHVAITGPEKQINESLKRSQQSSLAFDVLHVPFPKRLEVPECKKRSSAAIPDFPFLPQILENIKQETRCLNRAEELFWTRDLTVMSLQP